MPLADHNWHLYAITYDVVYNARADYGIVGGAISLLLRTSDSDITLRSLPALELVTHLFARFGVLAKPSQAGLVTNRLISQMGGIQGCRVFKIEGVRTLIAGHKPDQNFDRSHACRIIGNFDEVTKRMRFEPFEDLFISPRPRSRKLQPQDALDKLLMQRVFRVGLKLLCPHCKLTFWLLLDEVKTDIACTFCGIAFDVTRQLRDRNWAYRRSGLFGRGDNQHGGIPVALTLQQLDTQLHSKGMLYTTCLELAPPRLQGRGRASRILGNDSGTGTVAWRGEYRGRGLLRRASRTNAI